MFNKQILFFLLIRVCPVLISLQAQAAAHKVLNDLPLEGRYAVSAAIGYDRPGFHARMTGPAAKMDNAGHGLLACFSEAGAALTAGGRSFSLRPVALGYGADLAALPSGLPRVLDNMVVLERGALSEWYVNGPLGLQQGVTVPVPPQAGDGPLTIALALDGVKTGTIDADGCGVTLTGAEGRLRYRYLSLVVRDSAGRLAPAWLEGEDAGLRICVADAGHAYPLYIDPVIEQAKLTALDGAAGDNFGWSVAVSGDTVVVGAYGDDSYKGSAYVFVKPESGWADMTETAKLTASDGAGGDSFGTSVAAGGDTVVAGAFEDDSWKGSAYMFVKPESGWGDMTETAKLTASDGAGSDYFGLSVAVSGDTVVAGADGDNSRRGAAYVFKIIADEPFVGPAGISFTDITASTMTVHWSPGSGTGRIVVMREAGPVDADPSDGTTYAASAAFGEGSEIGTGNYVVYSGSGESVTVTNLSPATTYHVAVYEYASYPPYEAANYLDTAATGSSTTKAEPVALDDSYTTEKNTPLSVAGPGVLDNDTDPDGGTLTAALVITATHGTLSLAADGSFIYIPEKGYIGTDSFTYTATDGVEASAAATVTITVDRPCPAVQLYGEGSCEVELLRQYRDKVLQKTAAGRLVVTLYYRLAPGMNRLLTSAMLREKVKRAVDALLPMLDNRWKE